MLDALSSSAMTRNNSCSSIRSVSKQRARRCLNPLYGYQIETIRAVKPDTIVYRLKADAYKRFLDKQTFRNWSERDLLSVFPPQIRMDGSSKKQQEQMLKQFTIREFQPNEVLLKHGTMPQEIFIVILGEI